MWDVFISHASEDKAAVARPLYELLKEAGLDVWLDEYELHVGDSLRTEIDRGLSGSRYGVVVLSKAFFSKDWPERELNALVALESSSRKVILPVWHGVDHKTVAKYSPILADRLASNTAKGLPAVAREILGEIRGTSSERAGVAPATSGRSRNRWKFGIGASLFFLIVSAALVLSSPLRSFWGDPAGTRIPKSQGYVAYGSVQLQGTRLKASTEVVLTVFLNAAPNFERVHLKLSGATIEGSPDGDLSRYLDPVRGSPQAVEVHLDGLRANARVVTCLAVPERDASAKSRLVRVRQVFSAIDSPSNNVDFVAIGAPTLAASEAACQL